MSVAILSMKGGEMMSLIQILELFYKFITILCGVLTLYIGFGKVIKTVKSKRKRNASNDVPK